MTLFQKFAESFLIAAEEVFLVAYGWRKSISYGEAVWIPPETFHWERKRGQFHGHRHAVNSQKAACADERRNQRLSQLREMQDGD